MASHLPQTTGNAEERGASEVAHTPGPWFAGSHNDALWITNSSPHLDNDWTRPGGDARFIARVVGNPDQADVDAAFIVRACNSHDALVDACNGLLGLLQLVSARSDCAPDLREILDTNHRVVDARAALAAVGKP